jgi:hypothetical protein
LFFLSSLLFNWLSFALIALKSNAIVLLFKLLIIIVTY